MKRQLNRIVLAWLMLGMLGAFFCALVAFSMTLFLKTVVDGWIIGGFAFLGFIPGMLGSCGQRFAGLLGYFGIIIGFVWGVIESIIKKGIIWPVFVYFSILQAFLLALAIGLIIQIFIKPRPLPTNKSLKKIKKTSIVSAIPKPKRLKKPQRNKKNLNVDQGRIYEI